MDRTTLTRAEYARAIGVSLSTVERLLRRSELPHCRIGSRIVFLPRHVEEFLATRERAIEAKGPGGRAA